MTGHDARTPPASAIAAPTTPASLRAIATPAAPAAAIASPPMMTGFRPTRSINSVATITGKPITRETNSDVCAGCGKPAAASRAGSRMIGPLYALIITNQTAQRRQDPPGDPDHLRPTHQRAPRLVGGELADEARRDGGDAAKPDPGDEEGEDQPRERRRERRGGGGEAAQRDGHPVPPPASHP